MSHTSGRTAGLHQLFHQALDLPEPERARWLADLSAQDPEIAASLQSLLRNTGAATDPFAAIVGELARAVEVAAEDRIGDRFGEFRVDSVIGEGGMGQVFRAQRVGADFEQTVAVKLLRARLLDPRTLDRFARERQILSRLRHPGIAALIDAGVGDQGVPYLAMEYVEGAALIDWCDQQRLGTQARIALVIELARALAYAHARLIVHLDIKPSNIVVNEQGVAKLLDFGIARLLDPEIEQAGATMTRVYTPDYASPEQVAGEPLGAASDQYSLAVLAFELLSGVLPWAKAARAGTFDAEPPSPRERVRTLDPHKRAALAHARGMSERAWMRSLGGDLALILARAMNADPAARYASIEALAADLSRHLDGLSPLGVRGARWQRFRKALWRNRLPLTAASLIGIGLAAWTFESVRSGRALALERDRALAAQLAAEAVSGYLVSIFESADPAHAVGREFSARELLDAGAARLDQAGLDAPNQIRLLQTLAKAYDNLGMLESALGHHRQAETRLASLGSAHAAAHVDARVSVADLLRKLGRHPEAMRHFEGAAALVQSQRLADTPSDANLKANLGLLLHQLGRADEAIATLEQAAALRRALGLHRTREHATTLHNLGLAQLSAGDRVRAASLLNEAHELKRQLLPEGHPSTLNTLSMLARLSMQAGALENALETQREVLRLRRKVLGQGHPAIGDSLSEIGGLLQDLGRYEEAEAAYRESIATLSASELDQAIRLNNLGTLLEDRHDHAGAETAFRNSVALRLRTLPESSVQVARSQHNHARALFAIGEHAQARERVGRALKTRESDPAASAWERFQSRLLLARIDADGSARSTAAAAALDESFDLQAPSTFPGAVYARLALAELLIDAGLNAAALTRLDQAVVLSVDAGHAEHPLALRARAMRLLAGGSDSTGIDRQARDLISALKAHLVAGSPLLHALRAIAGEG